MALTFAGQPLVVADSKLREKVEGLLSTLDLYETARLHWVANEVFPTQFGVSVDHHIEIGKLFWPAGASRWATAHFLVHQTEAEAIVAACWPDSSTYTSAELEMSWEEPQYENGTEGDTEIVDSISATMYPLPLRPIETDDSEGLYLLTLVDQRFFWWSKNTGAYHVSPGVTTWTDLWSSFGGFVGVGSVTVDSPVAAYLKPSRLLDLTYEPVPPWWDSAANSVGQRVVVSLDGSIYVQSPYATGPSEAEGVLAGGDFLGEVQLSQAPVTATSLFSDLSGGYVAKSHSGAGAIGEVVLRTFILADQQTEGELQAYADQWAADFDSWQQGDSDVKLAGIVNVEPNGTYGNIIWTYRRDELSTRVQPADFVERAGPLRNNGSNISSKICVSTSAKATNSQNTTTTVVVGLGLSSRICVSACLKATRDQISSPSVGLGISSKICVSACLKGLPESSSGYQVVQEEGSSLTRRQTVNFIGSGITAADDSGNTRTNVTLHTASASQEGTVSTGSQTFAGSKTFTTGPVYYMADPSAFFTTDGVNLARIRFVSGGPDTFEFYEDSGGLYAGVSCRVVNSYGSVRAATSGSGVFQHNGVDGISITVLGMTFNGGILTAGGSGGATAPVDSVTAGNDTITVAGTANDPTIEVNKESVSLNLGFQIFST